MLAPAPAPVVETSRLLWRTRGEHWDYEFICVPEIPALPAWLTALEAMIGDADASAGELRYGLLEIDEPGPRGPLVFPYVATRFLDPARKDWTGRQVQHFAVWFPPIPEEAIEALPGAIPADWHLRVLEGLAGTYGSGEVFGLPEAAVRASRRGVPESRAARAMAIVKRTPPVALLEGDAAPARWKRAPTLKKKCLDPPDAVSLQAAGAGDGGKRPGLGCFAVGLLVILAVGRLMIGWVAG
ncbi:hypothetical protein WMF27_16315 [Sorangium sp. So ce281]|uniref:hypothetical protein n=1 Tax=unclassified Sorangium TaxID=2621164 RepID=UPI003F632A51